MYVILLLNKIERMDHNIYLFFYIIWKPNPINFSIKINLSDLNTILTKF